MPMPTQIRIWWSLLIARGCEADTLGQLVYLHSVDPDKANSLAWCAATKPGIKSANGWLGKATRERLQQMELYPDRL